MIHTNPNHQQWLHEHEMDKLGKVMLLSPELARDRMVEAVLKCAMHKWEAEQRVKLLRRGTALSGQL